MSEEQKDPNDITQISFLKRGETTEFEEEIMIIDSGTYEAEIQLTLKQPAAPPVGGCRDAEVPAN